MTYCLNPDCPKPQQVDLVSFCPHCGFRVCLGDRYWAVRLLGAGASGRTWLALDQPQSSPENSSTFCIVQQSPRSTDFLSLFQNSQRWQELGDHPQLPALLDCFEQDSYWYGVQAYIPGESLASILVNRGKFCASQVWQVLDSMLSVLQFIHAHGVIHRDIKPDTIIRRSASDGVQGRQFDDLVLVDFKAAIALPKPAIVFSQSVAGHSAYAAPEQMRGQATFASDLYSLGVTCIQLLTDMHPFHLMDAATHTWVWQNYWLSESASTADRLSHQHLAQFLDRLIASDLTQRFTTTTEALATLHQFRGKHHPISKVTPIQPSSWICYATLVGHQGLFANVNGVAIASDSRTVASASDDKTIRLWNGQTGEELGVLQGHRQFVTAIAFHPQNPDILASGSRDRTIKLWHGLDEREIRTLAGHSNAVNTVLITPEGKWLISGSADRTVKVWEVDSGTLVSSLAGHRLAVNKLAYHGSVPGCSHPVIASASMDTTVKLWDLNTFTCIHTFMGHTATVKAIAFSPSGQWLATAGEDCTIRIWDISSRQCSRVLPGHSWPISALLFTAEGDVLISSSEDKTVKLWQVCTGQVTGILVGHDDAVSGVAIAPNQQILATSSHDKTVKLWKNTTAPSSIWSLD